MMGNALSVTTNEHSIMLYSSTKMLQLTLDCGAFAKLCVWVCAAFWDRVVCIGLYHRHCERIKICNIPGIVVNRRYVERKACLVTFKRVLATNQHKTNTALTCAG